MLQMQVAEEAVNAASAVAETQAGALVLMRTYSLICLLVEIQHVAETVTMVIIQAAYLY